MHLAVCIGYFFIYLSFKHMYAMLSPQVQYLLRQYIPYCSVSHLVFPCYIQQFSQTFVVEGF